MASPHTYYLRSTGQNRLKKWLYRCSSTYCDCIVLHAVVTFRKEQLYRPKLEKTLRFQYSENNRISSSSAPTDWGFFWKQALPRKFNFPGNWCLIEIHRSHFQILQPKLPGIALPSISSTPLLVASSSEDVRWLRAVRSYGDFGLSTLCGAYLLLSNSEASPFLVQAWPRAQNSIRSLTDVGLSFHP